MRLHEIWHRKSAIFKDESKLSIDYVPVELPNREDELLKLAGIFKSFVENPGSLSPRAILIGPVGTGKTVTAKYFGKQVEDYAYKRNSNIKYVHVNCHKDRTLYLLMTRVAEELNLHIPRRGFSSRELMNIIWSTLENRNQYLILTIDETDYLIATSGSEAIYDLTRLYDECIADQYRISLIFILRDYTKLYKLEECVRSSLLHNIIKFEPYTSDQIVDILESRIYKDGAIYPEAIDEEVLHTIGELVGVDKGGKGDARQAIEILWRAGKYAECEGANKITVEHVRKAYSDIYQVSSIYTLDNLRKHELILLLAVVRTLKLKGTSEVALGEVEQEYRAICKELNERPRGHTKVWEYVKTLKNFGIVNARLSGPGRRGKTTLISIPSIPLEALEKEILSRIMS